jgi:flavin reductase (DIM6/NTAB) family NADH-FMN oxidoreductase RutF
MSISADQYKEFFRHHGAGVSIVTTFDENRSPFGFTASSLASLSTDPALASVNLAKGTSTAGVLKIGSPIAIHTLSAQNQNLAAELAGPRENRFSSQGWDLSGAAPVNSEASAVMVGQVEKLFEVAGSLMIVVSGTEVELRVFPETPLIYFNRKYL